MDRKFLVFLMAALFLIGGIFSVGVIALEPTGANYSGETTQATNLSNGEPESHDAYAGNVTEMDVEGPSVSQYWQGYYGNVSGRVELANAAGNIMYNWSGSESVTGEVYVSNVSSGIIWGSVQCLDVLVNSTNFEGDFNVSQASPEGLNETFSANDHAAFSTASVSFSANDCNSTKILNSSGDGAFDEVLLTDSTGATNLIFAAIINQDTIGFDGATHDFQMLVLENGASGVADPTTYYFYTELA